MGDSNAVLTLRLLMRLWKPRNVHTGHWLHYRMTSQSWQLGATTMAVPGVQPGQCATRHRLTQGLVNHRHNLVAAHPPFFDVRVAHEFPYGKGLRHDRSRQTIGDIEGELGWSTTVHWLMQPLIRKTRDSYDAAQVHSSNVSIPMNDITLTQCG